MAVEAPYTIGNVKAQILNMQGMPPDRRCQSLLAST